ncbi:MAG: D-alanine--D-alanine ligase [Gemmatimonadales bacterium]
MQVTILTGGSTAERNVALAGGHQVAAALRDRGHSVIVVDTVEGPLGPDDESRILTQCVGPEPPSSDELRQLAAREHVEALATLPELRDADLVFLLLHGRQGEGGEVQALLELAGITYTGSGPVPSAVAMDKDIAKRLFRDAGITTPDWRMWPSPPDEIAQLGYPLIVKPSKTGSTLGLSLVKSETGLEAAVEAAREHDDEIMLEQFVEGREFTMGVLGDRVLALGEIIPDHPIFDYECKYTPGLTQEVFPAAIQEELRQRLRAMAIEAHRCLKLRDFSRVDFRIDCSGTPHCLEVNTLPGLTVTSLLPQSAAAVGISFGDLCEEICRVALERSGVRNKVRA